MTIGTDKKGGVGWSKWDIPAALCLAVLTFMSLEMQFARTFYSTGDRGRDLYTALLVMRGQVPYIDFDWPYGPIMPFYYSVFYRLFGVSILSFEIGENVLRFLCAMAVYWMARGALRTGGALAVGSFFQALMPMAYTTANHVGGVLSSVVAMGFFIRFLNGCGSRGFNLYGGAISLVLLSLVKLNMGAAFAGAFAIVVFALQQTGRLDGARSMRPRETVRALLILGIPVFTVYAILLALTPPESIPICFPYLPGYHLQYPPIMERLRFELETVSVIFGKQPIVNFVAQVLLAFRTIMLFLVLIVCGIFLIFEWKKSDFRDGGGAAILFGYVALLAGAHEFLLAGSWYSMSYWCTPAWAFLTVFTVARLGEYLNRRTRQEHLFTRLNVLSAVVFSIASAVVMFVGVKSYTQTVEWEKVDHPRGGVWRQRQKGELSSWAQTVTATARAIEELTQPGEPILVVPFEPIYLFLADRPQACRLMDFSGYQQLDTAAQERVIRQLEEKNVRLVVWANTIMVINGKMDEFGGTSCARLGDYIRRRYFTRPELRFGEKTQPGYGVLNHGTKILIREDQGQPRQAGQ
ncbi:MAG TPA: hypothetical protein PL033_01035 [Candidatus Brocadiia bacterium]|nr:hypothetical protein [Candidatus Brocadiia bacterium]